MSKRLLSLVVAVLALGLVAAGCGNDDSAGDKGTGSDDESVLNEQSSPDPADGPVEQGDSEQGNRPGDDK